MLARGSSLHSLLDLGRCCLARDTGAPRGLLGTGAVGLSSRAHMKSRAPLNSRPFPGYGSLVAPCP